MTPSPAATAPLRVAGHLLDVQAGTLHDAAGAPVVMRPQAWAVLELLARHAGQVVTKERLLEAVWPGLVVTEGSITQAVKDLRLALGDDGHRVVKTLPRRGYMLVAADGGEPDAAIDAPRLRDAGPLFGRDAELTELRQLLQQHRLVTVLGAGGIGKTVFALAAAHRHVDDDVGQAAWVDLANLSDPALLPATIARALGLPVSQGDDPVLGLLSALRPVTAWLVLDNAEHMVDAVAGIAQAVLAAAPGLRLLVTSQVPLHLAAERLLRLSALAVPEADAAFADAVEASAVAMFVDRARAMDHRFELTPHSLAAVVRLCKRLDGLPLAIRLAAGRVHLLGLSGLEAQLDDRFRWLTSATRDVPTRQQTLAAALDWSHGLLAASEQRVYRQLGVFVGGFTVELMAAVARSPTADEDSVIAELEGLVERSLVSVVPGPSHRYRLLESQREHALRELEREGELEAARRRHAEAMTEALSRAAEAFWSTPDGVWMARWSAELDNIRAAMKWSEGRDVALCTSLISSVTGMFRLLDLGHELVLQAQVLAADSIERLDAAAATRFWLARAYLETGRSGRARHDYADRAERCARAAGDRRRLYLALCHKGTSVLVQPGERDALLAEIARLESPDWPSRVRCQRWLAEMTAHSLRDEWAQALRAAETGLQLSIDGGFTLLTCAFGNFTMVALLGLGDVDAALARGRALRPHLLPSPASMVIPYVGTCARISLMKGDLAATRRELARMFELSRSVEWNTFEVFGGVYLGLALAESRHAAAGRLLGYAEAAGERAWGVSWPSREREAARVALAAFFDAAELARLCAEGATLDPESVCRLVLG
jgi:predicted ATPase/DNA-binding winged helix-turn-helix (wHTH) protein